MEQTVIKTPLGFAIIKGDENGIASISVSDYYDLMLNDVIPECLQEVVYQLEEYFQGKRKTFSVTLNPEGTEFQKKIWEELLNIPYGETISYLALSRRFGDEKSHKSRSRGKCKKSGLDHYSLPQGYRERRFTYGICRRTVAKKMAAGA